MTKLYVGLSGGKDSTALSLLLHERGLDFEMVMADTGAELPENYYHIPRLASYLGRRVTVVSSGTFFQHLMKNNFLLPRPQMRWCTQVLKDDPLRRYFVAVGAESVAVGIRADEASRQYLSKVPEFEYVFPMVEAGMGEKDSYAMCRKHGMLSLAYEWRSSTSCFCCPFQTPYDWIAMCGKHPTLYALAEDWESLCIEHAKRKGGSKGYTWRQDFSLAQLRDMVRRQVKFDFFPDEEPQPCTICKW